METSGGSRGLWNNPRPQWSKEVQDMMRLRKEESKLTCFQRKPMNRNSKTSAQTPDPSSPSSSEPVRISLPRKTQRRSAESCRSGNGYEREKFRPGPTRDLEKEKRRLQNILSTGKESTPEPLKPQKSTAGRGPEASEEVDRHQEVLNEIDERRQFLADVAALGQERPYVDIINTEISQKIRELELLDRTSSHK
ncbi:UPF0193 protein EVG1 [Nematolebias whitei]|uniref:UPF0193 protein EVG1 n=1 Tax=Nematolebias whitei TaxID=451745 RepID=UPI00189B4EDA|nr:UPF0193 protein EVG1 [Nematolebias whitei]